MGRMIKEVYVGVYLELKDENAHEIIREDDFYCKFEDKFIFPYQGLESQNILILHGKSRLEYDDEHVINLTYLDLETEINAFEIDNKQLLIDVKEFFEFELKYGVVSYWDEIA